MALRVLHIIGGGDTGGAMSHLLPLVSALRRAGCDARLLCLGEGGLAESAERRDLPVTVLPMRGAHDLRVLGPLRKVVDQGPTDDGWPTGGGPRWDVVHTHGMRANVPARLVVPNLRRSPCLFTTIHSDVRLDYQSGALGRAYSGLDHASLRPVDCVICVSESLRKLLVARGYPAERLITVRSGLEASQTCAAPPDGSDETADTPATAGVAEREAAPSRGWRVGTTTRLVAVKDMDLLLEAAAILHDTRPDLELVIMGEGPERERLEAMAADLGLQQAVRFTGRVEDVPARLRQLDVFMVTSIYEGGVSISVLEAMAAGLPVVVTAAGGVEEAVLDGETGYVVSREQERGALAAALAERAAALLDDPALRARMGAAGARRVRADFTIERAAAQTLRAYERCLAARDRL